MYSSLQEYCNIVIKTDFEYMFNDLQEEFLEQDCEIETVAREAIAEDFLAIAKSYGFSDAEVEELIANRDW